MSGRSIPADSSAQLLVVACQALGRRGKAFFDDVKVEDGWLKVRLPAMSVVVLDIEE